VVLFLALRAKNNTTTIPIDPKSNRFGIIHGPSETREVRKSGILMERSAGIDLEHHDAYALFRRGHLPDAQEQKYTRPNPQGCR
jgi:hypothetical protein